jgi:hypothetical protein
MTKALGDGDQNLKGPMGRRRPRIFPKKMKLAGIKTMAHMNATRNLKRQTQRKRPKR